MPTTAELIGELKSSVAKVSEQVADQTKTFNEKVDQVERMVDDIKAQQTEIRRNHLPPDAPVDEADDPGVLRMTKSGISSDKFGMLPFEKTLSMSPNHPAVKGTDIAGELTRGQDMHDACALVYSHYKATKGERYAEEKIKKHPDFQLYAHWLERNGYFKANEIGHPGSSGVGEKLVFTLLAAQLLERVRIESQLTGDVVEVPLTRPSQKFPVLTGDSLGVLGGQEVQQPPPTTHLTNVIPSTSYFSAPTFADITFTVKHCLGMIQFNDDLAEDSVIPWMPIARSQVALAIARARDRAIFQGDPINNSTGELDSDRTYTAMDFRKAWYGLRFMTRTNRTVACGNNAYTDDDVQSLRLLLDLYGSNPNDLVHYSSVASWIKLMETAEVMTLDKFGPQATIKTGVLGKLYGIDLKVHEYVETDLDADGTDAGASGEGNREVAYMWNRTRFMLGQYLTTDIEVTRWAPMLYSIVQADVRQDFQAVDQHLMTSYVFGAAAAPAALAINIANS